MWHNAVTMTLERRPETLTPPFLQAARLAGAMERDLHYTVDEKQKSVLITEEGYEAAEDVLQARAPLINSLCAPAGAAPGTGILWHLRRPSRSRSLRCCCIGDG